MNEPDAIPPSEWISDTHDELRQLFFKTKKGTEVAFHIQVSGDDEEDFDATSKLIHETLNDLFK